MTPDRADLSDKELGPNELVDAIARAIERHVVWSSLVMQEHGMVSDDGAQKVSFGAIVFVATDGDETPAICQLGHYAMGGLTEGASALLSMLPDALERHGCGVMREGRRHHA